jgi:hypothetical protein
MNEWQILPPGYEITYITRADGRHPRPSCDHFENLAVGPSLDCTTRATHGLPAPEEWRDYRAYACDRHATDDLSQIAGAGEED